jgi:hypothetical protein
MNLAYLEMSTKPKFRAVDELRLSIDDDQINQLSAVVVFYK